MAPLSKAHRKRSSGAVHAMPAPHEPAYPSRPYISSGPAPSAPPKTQSTPAAKSRSSASQTPGTTKQKTKAKQRYLNRKKEKRKLKKKSGSRHADAEATERNGDAGEGTKGKAESAESLLAQKLGGDTASPGASLLDKKSTSRTKKRKLSVSSGSSSGSSSDISSSDSSSSSRSATPDPVSPAEEQVAPSAAIGGEVDEDEPVNPGLVAFPRPRGPARVSREALASLGMPEGMAKPMVVDPALRGSIGAPRKHTGDAGEDEEDGGHEGEDGDQAGLERQDMTQLSHGIRRRLRKMGIKDLFAVQTTVIPLLLSQPYSSLLYSPHYRPRDLCVSAPTGSGKTLAYVVPVIETLLNRVVTRLRALVILPTRDLVTQVKETFELMCAGTGLKVGVATGHHSFPQEQLQLVGDIKSRCHGGLSKVDILIATPGRLMDHLTSTPNFTLQHLRFLIIDEADRLMNQSFQDWLTNVLASIKSPHVRTPTPITSSMSSHRGEVETSGASTLRMADSATTDDFSKVDASSQPDAIGDAVAPAWVDSAWPGISTDVDETRLPSCQKLLFSATMTRDPAKIAAMDLYEPLYVSVQETKSDGTRRWGIVGEDEEFTLPGGLRERMLVSDTASKPLMLLHLLHNAPAIRNCLCFTKSVESTERLVKLVEFFEDEMSSLRESGVGSGDVEGRRRVVVKAYSSDLPNTERRMMLKAFKEGEVDVLICSDLVARGIDLPHVAHVVNYDVPLDMRKYVHRVGRTARAGREGDAWSLVEEHEARYFKKMLGRGGRLDKVKKEKAREKEMEKLVPLYEAALSKLAQHFG